MNYITIICILNIILIMILVILYIHKQKFKNHFWNTWEEPKTFTILNSFNKLPVTHNNIRKSTGLGKDFDVYLHILGQDTHIEEKCYMNNWNRTCIWCLQQQSTLLCIEHLPAKNIGKDITRLVFIPNQELVTVSDEYVLIHSPILEYILCKNNYTFNIFNSFKRKHNCKWSVIEFNFPPIVKQPFLEYGKNRHIFLHSAGKSWMKNTSLVIETWREHPEWPFLVVSCADECLKRHTTGEDTSNIIIYDFLNSNQINKLQKHAGYSICPSACEGFGHSLYEAMANGNVLITGDIPPINEYINDKNAIVINAYKEHLLGHKSENMKFVESLSSEIGESGSACFEFRKIDLEFAIQNAINMTDSEYVSLQNNAFNDWKHFVKQGLHSTESALNAAGFTSNLKTCWIP